MKTLQLFISQCLRTFTFSVMQWNFPKDRCLDKEKKKNNKILTFEFWLNFFLVRFIEVNSEENSPAGTEKVSALRR